MCHQIVGVTHELFGKFHVSLLIATSENMKWCKASQGTCKPSKSTPCGDIIILCNVGVSLTSGIL